MPVIDEQFLETPWYGSRQMGRHLRRRGHAVNRKRVRRLMERAARETAANARRAFDHAVAIMAATVAERPGEGDRVTAWWREVIGWPAQMLGREGRFADLILFAQAPDVPARTSLLEAALFDTGRPILLASAATATDAFPSVAIGWDGSPPAARAVGGAMPVLTRAASVSVLTVEEGADTRHMLCTPLGCSVLMVH